MLELVLKAPSALFAVVEIERSPISWSDISARGTSIDVQTVGLVVRPWYLPGRVNDPNLTIHVPLDDGIEIGDPVSFEGFFAELDPLGRGRFQVTFLADRVRKRPKPVDPPPDEMNVRFDENPPR